MLRRMNLLRNIKTAKVGNKISNLRNWIPLENIQIANLHWKNMRLIKNKKMNHLKSILIASNLQHNYLKSMEVVQVNQKR